MLVGIPTILLVKFCSKALAKWSLPIVANTLGLPIKSTSYIPALTGLSSGTKSDEVKQSGYLQKMLFFSRQASFDVDTGIRLLQYAGLAWSVVDLVPSLFSQLSLWYIVALSLSLCLDICSVGDMEGKYICELILKGSWIDSLLKTHPVYGI